MTKNIKFKNRRKFHRINFDGKVKLEFVADSYDQCQVKNLSLTGMFVTGKFKQEEDGSCLLSLFRTAETERVHLRASAKVVWSNDEGAGLKFTSMTFESYMLLLTTLINYAEQPAIILHEFPRKNPFEVTGA